MDRDNNRVDICVIGAGWSGLLAGKYALENNLSLIMLERREGLGGVWNYTTNPDIVTVMDTTVTSSSATVTEASDFPIRPEMGNFVHRVDVQQYLVEYAEHFGLIPYIRFNQDVVKAEKQGDSWFVHTQDHVYQSRFLVVCAGPYQDRRRNLEEITEFTGRCAHIGEIKSISPDAYTEHDHILVYGGGESASDIVELLVRTRARVTWSIPNGQHFFRKAAIFGRPATGEYRPTDPAIDEASSKCIQYIVSFASEHSSKPGMRWLCTLASTGTILGYEGHGIAAWKKGVPFMHAMTNKNGHVVEYVHSGRVTAKGKIVRANGHCVVFNDGTSDEFTDLILCTGYLYRFPYLPAGLGQKPLDRRYKYIFDPDDPTLLFIGYARPVIGSIPLMTEVQCLYAFRALSGKLPLPEKQVMMREIQNDIAYNDRYFHQQRRPGNLVNPFHYAYGLAQLGGFNPDYFRLLLADPKAFVKTFFSPVGAPHFVLQDQRKRRAAVDQIWSRQRWSWFMFPWIYLVARLLKVDDIIDIFARRKYRKQIQVQPPLSKTPAAIP